MSWQAYIDDNLLKSGMVTAAGIYDLQGNPWAYSAGFAAQIAEVAAVSAHMHTGDPSGLAGTGVVLAGVKYMYVAGSADEVYGKKGQEGVVFCKCNTCLIVGYHNDKIQPGSLRLTVGKLADFLKESVRSPRLSPILTSRRPYSRGNVRALCAEHLIAALTAGQHPKGRVGSVSDRLGLARTSVGVRHGEHVPACECPERSPHSASPSRPPPMGARESFGPFSVCVSPRSLRSDTDV